jgi:hypothetical protein
LTIDLERQRYFYGSESGDVFDWLMRRFSWTFGQAVSYLKNRADLPPKMRGELQPAIEEEPAPEISELVDLEVIDRQTADVLQLGVDYPKGGLVRFLDCTNYITLVLEASWMPAEFIPLIGLILEGCCSYCENDLSMWQSLGQAFLAVDREADDLMIHHSAEVYCSDCVNRFRRWQKALAMLAERARRREVAA